MIFKMKAWLEHRDKMEVLVEEIGEFCLQPLPEDCHPGDSCFFFLFFLENLAIADTITSTTFVAALVAGKFFVHASMAVKL